MSLKQHHKHYAVIAARDRLIEAKSTYPDNLLLEVELVCDFLASVHVRVALLFKDIFQAFQLSFEQANTRTY